MRQTKALHRHAPGERAWRPAPTVRAGSLPALVLTLIVALIFIVPAAETLQAQDTGSPYKPFPDEHSFHHWGRDRHYDLIHTRVDITPDFETLSIAGTSTIRLRPLAAGLETVHIDGAELDIGNVLVNGREAEFSDDAEGILISLDRAYGPADELEVSIDYATRPRAGLWFVVPDKAYPKKPKQIWTQGETEWSRYYFPCYDYPNDMGTSEMIATVPKGFYAVSNGALEERRDNGDGTETFHWRESVPHVTYLVALAVGEFEVIEETDDGLLFQYIVRKEDAEKAERSFGKTPDMMRFFNANIGVRYPYEKYAQVCAYDYIWGGMENVSCTILTDRTLHDQRAHLDFKSDGLVAHELAHQWFGDYLTCKDWAHNWLNESFASYFDRLYTEHDLGVDEFRLRMREAAESYMAEDKRKYRRPIVTHYYTHPLDLFDRHAYPKGACILHMTRYLLGDEVWWKAINLYVERNKLRPVETNDFKQALEEASGRDFDGFFDQWLYSGGHPTYETSWSWDAEEKLVVYNVSQTQVVDELTPLFDMPVVIGLYGKGWEETYKVRVHKREHEFVFPAREKPKMILFDVGNWILKQVDADKHSREWRHQLTYAEDVVARIDAAKGLARKSAKIQNLDALESAVKRDPFHGVRAEAARTLGKLGGSRAKALLGLALEDQKSTVRKRAAEALAEFENDTEVFAWLERAAGDDESYAVRASALRALAEGKFEGASKVLERALEQESHNEVVRAAALSGFATLEDEKGLEHCKRFAEYGRRREVRSAAVEAMARLGKDLDEGKKKEIREFLEDLLEIDRQFLHVQRAIARSLGTLGDRGAVAALEKARQNALDRRYIVDINKAIAKLEKAPTGDDPLDRLREQVVDLEEENRKLRERIEKLEDRLEEEETVAGGGDTGEVAPDAD